MENILLFNENRMHIFIMLEMKLHWLKLYRLYFGYKTNNQLLVKYSVIVGEKQKSLS